VASLGCSTKPPPGETCRAVPSSRCQRGEPGYLRTTIHESVESAQDQYVTALRHVAGKSYPSPDWYGRAALCTCSRTVFCTS
jgi:hypothetical protein